MRARVRLAGAQRGPLGAPRFASGPRTPPTCARRSDIRATQFFSTASARGERPRAAWMWVLASGNGTTRTPALLPHIAKDLEPYGGDSAKGMAASIAAVLRAPTRASFASLPDGVAVHDPLAPTLDAKRPRHRAGLDESTAQARASAARRGAGASPAVGAVSSAGDSGVNLATSGEAPAAATTSTARPAWQYMAVAAGLVGLGVAGALAPTSTPANAIRGSTEARASARRSRAIPHSTQASPTPRLCRPTRATPAPTRPRTDREVPSALEVAHHRPMAARRRAPNLEEAIVARLRALCLAFPEANERISRVSDVVRGQGQGVRDARRPPPRCQPPLGVAAGAALGAGVARRGCAGAVLSPALRRAERVDGVVLDARPEFLFRPVEEHLRDAYLHVAVRRLRERLLSGPK